MEAKVATLRLGADGRDEDIPWGGRGADGVPFSSKLGGDTVTDTGGSQDGQG